MVTGGFINIGPNMDLWGSLWGTGYSETSITTGNTITGTCYSSASARAMTARTMLWSSIFVTLVAKKYHESVTLPSGLRMVYDNH